MKHLLLISAVFIMLLSCRKQQLNDFPNDSYAQQAWHYLKDSLSVDDFRATHFDKSFIIENPDGRFLRIEFGSDKKLNQFVLLQIDSIRRPFQGRIVSIERNVADLNLYEFNGNISISSLNRRSALHSEIRHGYIRAYQTRNMYLTNIYGTDVHPDPAQYLPEFVVIGYRNHNDYADPYLIDQIRYLSMFSPVYSQSYGFYSPMNPYGYYYHIFGYGSSYPSTTGFNYTTPATETSNASPSVAIEYDDVAQRPALDLNKIFKCFDYVPSAGATYTLKLCTDVPVNSNPFASMDNSSMINAGHSFISLTKSNGNASVTQSFGFYPSTMPSAFDPFTEVLGAIKDNGATEINASIEVKISEAQFSTLRYKAKTATVLPYSLADNNCANYAIDLFSSVSGIRIDTKPLSIPLGTANPYNPTSMRSIEITKTPQMLFVALEELKSSGQVSSQSIVINRSHDYRAPTSKGECN